MLNKNFIVARTRTGVIVGTWGLNTSRAAVEREIRDIHGITAQSPIKIRKESHIVDSRTGALITD